MSEHQKCVACGNEGRYSVLLSKTRNAKVDVPEHRYYIPNQTAREMGALEETWFCAKCMRFLEDNLRASILYLQAESQLASGQ